MSAVASDSSLTYLGGCDEISNQTPLMSNEIPSKPVASLDILDLQKGENGVRVPHQKLKDWLDALRSCTTRGHKCDTTTDADRVAQSIGTFIPHPDDAWSMDYGGGPAPPAEAKPMYSFAPDPDENFERPGAEKIGVSVAEAKPDVAGDEIERITDDYMSICVQLQEMGKRVAKLGISIGHAQVSMLKARGP